MKLCLLVCVLGCIQATTTSVSREQQCLEDFVSLTQSWFSVIRHLSLDQMDVLLSASAQWGHDCEDFQPDTVTSSPKVEGLLACYRTLKRLPGVIAQLSEDVVSRDSQKLMDDAVEVLDVLQSLAFDCGIL